MYEGGEEKACVPLAMVLFVVWSLDIKNERLASTCHSESGDVSV